MSSTHQAFSETNQSVLVTLHDVPDECPQCHHKGTFSPINLLLNSIRIDDRKLQVIFRCPNSKCHDVFIGYYSYRNHGYNFERMEPRKSISTTFSPIIQNISPNFSGIYNQALRAENDGLDQICGPGYRKALEFIIKDYLIGKESDVSVKEKIQKEQLGASISNRIADTNIKEVAKRAAWLGNDETHYIRKWDTKDLQDLKKLIALTIHWMEAEALTSQLLNDMPDTK